MNSFMSLPISLLTIHVLAIADQCQDTTRHAVDVDEVVLLQVDFWAAASQRNRRVALSSHHSEPTLHAATNSNASLVTYGGNPLEDVGDTVGSAVQSVGDAVGGAVQDVGNVVSGVANAVDNVKDAVSDGLHVATEIAKAASVVEGIVNGVKIIEDLRKSNLTLDGHSKEFINKTILVIVLIVGFLTLTAYAFEKWLPQYSMPKDRPALWVLTMLSASYVLLIPSLGQILFSFKIVGNLLGFHIVLTSGDDATASGCITESALEVVRLLFKTGSYPGALFLILYAMVIPTVKLVVLLISEYYRYSANPGALAFSRKGIMFVQYISKWACPDMFAYILLLYLLRKLPENTDLISAPAKLDVGFSCFSAFCVLSTFACLGIKPPALPENSEGGDDAPVASIAARTLGQKGIVWLTVVAFLSFLTLLVLGMSLPCMALQINSQAFVEPNGPAPKELAPLIEGLHLDQAMNARVNVWQCLQALVTWAWTEGEGNCVFALIMLGLFAIMLPICNMFALALATFQLHDFKKQNAGGSLPEDAKWIAYNSTMKLVKFLGHISMLDVFIMGVVVVTFAACMYKKMGVIFSLDIGIAFLFMAEVTHYATYFLVCGVADDHERDAQDSLKS